MVMPGLQQAFCIIVQVKTGVVHFFLAFGELAIYRYGTRKVGTIAAIFGAKVHQHQFAVFAFLVIANIVQRTRPVAAGNNTAISWPVARCDKNE